ncbi:SusC/RagA family TonB-linked outer membrane protein [Ulvibacterium marinum]|uniref:TonB-dependent receptor n=1 Tax=Ulvibacterium marinum TaxID=2419782 RepID=A0A3B0BYQ4_9FLAO|nr:TonB-dependent receptor [Ulvibacterium marinum]RKN77007.1 TonB-dependent receptor [Ulvibacterium marinum]
MKLKRCNGLIPITLLLFSSFSVLAQNTISGTVTDAETGQPLPGATVLASANNGTTTDFDGNYTIQITAEETTLTFSYVGYAPQEVAVDGRTTINVQLTLDSSQLDEVVVIGYGAVKKSDFTGSLSSVKPEELTALPAINVNQALTGRAAGVQIIQNSGAPGANISVRIRGGNSLLGNNEPLYVVDGFPINGNPSYINPNDIESIEVLKDASATAIYGSRGANGVVMITTKTGKAGVSRIEFETYIGFQETRKRIDLLNAREFAEIANERAANDGQSPFFTDGEVASFGEGTDWQDAIFRTAPIQNHVLTFSGGSENTQYSVSASLFDQEGIVINSGFERYTIRGNINSRLNNWLDLSFSTILSRSDQQAVFTDNGQRGNSVLSAALIAPPVLPVFDADGNYTDVTQFPFSPGVAEHPVALARERRDDTQINDVLVNLALDFHLTKDLDFKVSAGVESRDSRRDFYSSSLLNATPGGSAQINTNRNTVLLNENILTYSPEINENNALTVTGGFSYQKSRSVGLGASAADFVNDILLNNNLEAGNTPGIPTSFVSEWTLLSGLGRINYDLMGKYLFTASFRADGSSRFGADNKWGYFPSAAFAWRISQEDFLKESASISDLKLRLSWGQTGSTAVSPFQTLNILGPATIVLNDEFFVGFAPGSNLPNPDLKWETTTQYNFGIDLGLFTNRLRLTADYYNKTTEDLLSIVPVPSSLGFTAVTQNVGEIENKGLEFTIGADILTGSFKWDISANLAANRTKVNSLANGSDVFGSVLSNPLQTSINIVREGEPVGVFFGFLEDGLDDNGQIIYQDLSGPDGVPDGEITLDDKTIIGDPNPDFIYGLNSNFSYKGFDLNLFIQGVQGVDIFNFNASQHANSFNFGGNQIDDILNRWTSANPNPNAPYPQVSVNTNFRESDRFVEDGSFLRLKNIRLAYKIPVQNLNIGLTNAQVYVSGQNLITITDYSWFDPEVSTRGGIQNGTPSFSQGIDQFGYPVAKTYTLGFRFGF